MYYLKNYTYGNIKFIKVISYLKTLSRFLKRSLVAQTRQESSTKANHSSGEEGFTR